ncbi:hypothetical protein ASG07_14770 [Sphingomonas sp. Leaf343]|nr:hypothetical protein ASG07_14770 [Sphingomonas sp. Leaf343]
MREWMANVDDPLAISDWTLTEVASALAMKQRRDVLTADERNVVEHEWSEMQSQIFDRVPIEAKHFHRAAKLVDAAPRGLRPGDALHLAVVLDRNCAFATLDLGLGAAAAVFGVIVHP